MTENAPPAEDYVLYADRAKAMRGLNRRLLFGMLPSILLFSSLFFYLSRGFSVPSAPAPHPTRCGGSR